jgi:hypothetical protein
MIRRLIEADIYRESKNPSQSKIQFWLSECRTPEILVSLSAQYPKIASDLAAKRSLLKSAIAGDMEEVQRLLLEEEQRERELDRKYWAPLKAELESWRHQLRS